MALCCGARTSLAFEIGAKSDANLRIDGPRRGGHRLYLSARRQCSDDREGGAGDTAQPVGAVSAAWDLYGGTQTFHHLVDRHHRRGAEDGSAKPSILGRSWCFCSSATCAPTLSPRLRCPVSLDRGPSRCCLVLGYSANTVVAAAMVARAICHRDRRRHVLVENVERVDVRKNRSFAGPSQPRNP